MRNFNTTLYLDGIRMEGNREPPINQSDAFIRKVAEDLFKGNEKKKHKCDSECRKIWTIGIGSMFVEKDCFYDCVPK